MSEHSVVVYVNEVKRTFTATARKESAKLSAVTDWCEQIGFAAQSVAEGLTKDEADELKAAQIAGYQAKGYIYKTRPAL